VNQPSDQRKERRYREGEERPRSEIEEKHPLFRLVGKKGRESFEEREF